jgi:hypothetical protein
MGFGSFLEGPLTVAVGDFNGDGTADLVLTACVQNNQTCTVFVTLGNGDGTFQTAVSYNIPSFSLAVAVGDFNGDGKADLVTANYQTNNVSVLLGNGDGTFQPPVDYSASPPGGTSSEPDALAVGDFNGDGKTDVAVGSFNGEYTLNILLGNGDGTFQVPVSNGPGSTISIAVGDFNGDGRSDVATGCYKVCTVLGNGDGTFQSAVNYYAGNLSIAVAVGDFNGDGRADIAAANSGSNTVSILLAAPAGSTTTALGSAPNPSALGQSVTLTAYVSPSTATGTVTFYDGSIELGVSPLSSGTATLALTTLSLGGHLLTAAYGGDATDLPSASAALTQNVLTPSTTKLTSSLNPSMFGQTVTLTATVSPANATGAVAFYFGSSHLGSIPLTAAKATLAVSKLPTGSQSLTALYSGDANYLTSTSPVLIQTVTKAASATALTSTPDPSNAGETVVLTATVTPAAAEGTVTFYHGSVVLGTGALNNGVAILAVAKLPAGVHLLAAVYGGDANHGSSVSSIRKQIVR